MTCNAPIPYESLVAWWAHELDDAEAARVEERIFSCDACTTQSARIAKVVGAVREHITPIISHQRRDELIARGVRIRFTPVEAGISARAVFDSDVDILVHVLKADLARVARVDIDVVYGDVAPTIHVDNVPFDKEAGDILVACQRHYRNLAPVDPVFRVTAIDEAGERQVIGEYFVEHVFVA